MKTTNHKFRPRISVILLIAIAAWAICGTSYAQSLIGSPGAGWQTWSTAPSALGDLGDLNSNGAPYWDVPFLAFGQYSGTPAAKSVGWCMTSNGDCQGIGSKLFAPGTLSFWSMPYTPSTNFATDSGGALDRKMYFKSNSPGASYQATLYLNTATNTTEINEFGWFETNSTGTVKGPRHVLFQGSGNPPGTRTPDPVGTTVTFQPTQYFGYYYQDVSDPQSLNPYSGCLAYTIFGFNDSDCTAAGQGDHVFAIFVQPSSEPTYWIAGQDPAFCNFDGDCNLTIVKVSAVKFAGTPGSPNCHGQSVSALAQQFGGLDAAAAALGFPSVQALQEAITAFCGG